MGRGRRHRCRAHLQLSRLWCHLGQPLQPGRRAAHGFAPLSATQQTAVRAALHAWSSLARITFVEVADTGGSVGDIRFGESAGVPTAQTYLPGANAAAGDVWLGPDSRRPATIVPAPTTTPR